LIVLIRGDILQFKLKLKWMLVRKKGRPSGRHFSSVSLVNIYLVKLQCFPRVPNKLYILKNVIFGVVVFLVFPAKSDKTVFPFHFYKRQVHRRFAFSTSIFRIFVERDSNLLMFKNLPYCAQVIRKKTNQESYLIFYFIETFVVLWSYTKSYLLCTVVLLVAYSLFLTIAVNGCKLCRNPKVVF
jgi:hypothetical protein